MPEIRERDLNDFIKSTGKPNRKGTIVSQAGAAMQEKVQEHRDKKEAANEYAVGITEKTAAEVAVRAGNIPGDIVHTTRHFRLKTKERVLNDIKSEPTVARELIVPEAVREQIQRGLAAEQAQENTQAVLRSQWSYKNQTYHPNQLPYAEHSNPPASAETERKVVSSAGAKNDIKEKPKNKASPKQRLEQEPKTRSSVEQSAHKTNRTAKQGTRKLVSKKASEQGRRKFKQEAQKKMAEQAKRAAKKTAGSASKAGAAIVQAAKYTVNLIVGMFGGMGFVAIVAVIMILALILASPLGIFFSNESTPNSVPLSPAISQINMELNTRLISLQSEEYTDIIVEGAPPSWTDVIAVFASYTAGSQNGVDVVQLTPDRVSRLQAIFWQMCQITSSTEAVTIPDSNPNDDIDDSRTEVYLTITIIGKTAEEMRSILGFSDLQNETMDILLSDPSALNGLIGNMSVSQQDALVLLRSLPQDLSPERRAVVQHALFLVGKVNYFWGGKSRVLGWDSRWGQLRKVTSAGSPTTGTYRPYGLDCSGFADWVFYNASGGEYILGHGGGAASQHRYCEEISWDDAQPGDLVFYPNDSHVGIVGLRDVNGNLLIIHCSSGSNNVVITDSSGFMLVGRPLYYGE